MTTAESVSTLCARVPSGSSDAEHATTGAPASKSATPLTLHRDGFVSMTARSTRVARPGYDVSVKVKQTPTSSRQRRSESERNQAVPGASEHTPITDDGVGHGAPEADGFQQLTGLRAQRVKAAVGFADVRYVSADRDCSG